MRQGSACGRCGAMRHGRRRHITGSAAMADCAECGTPVCERHASWDAAREAWVCTKCDRARKQGG